MFNAVHGDEFICPSIHDSHAPYELLRIWCHELWWLWLQSALTWARELVAKLQPWRAHTPHCPPTANSKGYSTAAIALTGGLPNIWDWSEPFRFRSVMRNSSVMHTLGAQYCHNTKTASYGVTVIIVVFAKVTSFVTYFKRLHRFLLPGCDPRRLSLKS